MKSVFEPGTTEQHRRRVAIVLAAAVFGISISGVLVRSMHDAEALAIAAWRTLLAGLVLLPSLRLITGRLERGEVLRILAAGGCLGFHFYLWFLSLEHTTVMRSTVLVCLLPIWVGLLEWGFEGEIQGRRYWIGSLLAILGVGSMSLLSEGEGSLYGDLLAVAGGILCAFYLMIGKSVRKRMHVTPYMCLICLVASLSLWPFALADGGKVWGYSNQTWLLLGAAVIGPQLVGHQGFNYAIRYVRASVVSIVSLLEPVGATLLAAVVLREFPGPSVLGGASLILVGVYWATRSDDESRAEKSTSPDSA
jgi:drug/metabolite transporter (DMT)-like permease